MNDHHNGKVLYVATVVKTHIMQFHIPYLKMFKDAGWETSVAAKNDYNDPEECVIPYCDDYYDIPIERSPFRPENIRAYKQLKKIIDKGDYDIIHCHTPMGAVLTRLAAGKARKRGSKVFYTAHGFHFYNGAPLINWLLYYPVERLLAHKTDVLITINKEDYERARSFKAGRIEYIPGVGIDTEHYSPDAADKSTKRKELGLKDEDFVLLSVGELIERKNHKIVLEALAVLKNNKEINTDNIKYIICGSGRLREDLERYAEELGIKSQVMFLGYRSDVNEICCASDLFIFMSRHEGLPVALLEAMSCGLPAISSNIRGSVDLLNDGENGLCIENDPERIAEAIIRMKEDDNAREDFAKKGRDVALKHDIRTILSGMKKIYNI